MYKPFSQSSFVILSIFKCALSHTNLSAFFFVCIQSASERDFARGKYFFSFIGKDDKIAFIIDIRCNSFDFFTVSYEAYFFP